MSDLLTGRDDVEGGDGDGDGHGVHCSGGRDWCAASLGRAGGLLTGPLQCRPPGDDGSYGGDLI